MNKEEAKDLVSLLRIKNVHSYIRKVSYEDVKSCQAIVNEKDIEFTQTIVSYFSKSITKKNGIDKLICSKCQSKPPDTHEKINLSLIKKIYTMGTTVIKCKKCGNEWYI